MMRFFGILFLAYCVLEIASLIAMGSWLGFGWTFLLSMATFAAGVLLIRKIGRDAIKSIRANRDGMKGFAATFPGTQLRFVAGILLIVPGFVSDAIALALLLPPVQAWANRKLRVFVGTGPPTPRGSDIIEGEAVEIVTENERIEGPRPPRA
jgi:UPF0716 protein FxsA